MYVKQFLLEFLYWETDEYGQTGHLGTKKQRLAGRLLRTSGVGGCQNPHHSVNYLTTDEYMGQKACN